MKVSVIVPCHNEAGSVERAYRLISAVLDRLRVDYEIIFEEDGSTDGTGDAIRRLSAIDKNVVALSFPRTRKGKGWGFRKLVEEATGDVIISMDADLSVSPDAISTFLLEMRTADILLTNRYAHKESLIPMRRRIPSLAYNIFLRFLFGIHVRDTQSGFKAYKARPLKGILLESDGFEYEVELLVKAYRKGLRVREIPVKYVYRKDARFSVTSHGPRMLVRTFRLWKSMNM